MRTQQISIYKFSELPEDAQQRAIDDWRQRDEPAWDSENRESLKAFESLFPISSTDWEYGYHNYINYKLDYVYDDEIFDLTGIRLLKYLVNNYWDSIYKGKYYSTHGNWVDGNYKYKFRHSNCQYESCCPFTGYFMDDILLDPIHEFIKNPNEYTTFEQLLYECLQAWVYACRDDWEYQQSDEYIKEIIEVNGYEFTENGDFY
jgi:hypothetical protein